LVPVSRLAGTGWPFLSAVNSSLAFVVFNSTASPALV